MLSPPPRIVISVGDDGVVVTPCGIDAEPFFAPETAAHEALSFIDAHPGVRLVLLADNLAQDYRTDTLPPLSPFDRMRLARRRLRQSFAQARLCAYARFRKSPDRILLVGLQAANPVFVWAERLRARLPDIVLLPVEGARLAARLMPRAKEGWAMLVSRQKSGGFRQIVTHKGDLVFTRLTPLPEPGGDDAAAIAADIKASLDYLARHGLREPRELEVLLLLPQADETAFSALPVRDVACLSPHEAAQRLGLPFAPDAQTAEADLLFAASVAARRPALPLMLPEMRRERRERDAQKWGMRLASLLLTGAIGLTMLHAGNLVMTLGDTRHAAALAADAHAELEHARQRAAPVTEPLGRLRQAIERRRIFARAAATPWAALAELGAALGPQRRIERLDWEKAKGQAATLSIGLGAGVDAGTPRPAVVAAFDRIAQDIIDGMPDYELVSATPPYPALPDQAVTADKGRGAETGEILLRARRP